VGVIARGIPRGCQGLFTPVSLGYPLSVFNKNSTLKELLKRDERGEKEKKKWGQKKSDRGATHEHSMRVSTISSRE